MTFIVIPEVRCTHIRNPVAFKDAGRIESGMTIRDAALPAIHVRGDTPPITPAACPHVRIASCTRAAVGLHVARCRMNDGAVPEDANAHVVFLEISDCGRFGDLREEPGPIHKGTVGVGIEKVLREMLFEPRDIDSATART
jgi:hypothetical protein